MSSEPIPGPGIYGTPAPRASKIEDLETVARFIQRYQNLVDAHAWRRLESFKEAFGRLRPTIQDLIGQSLERNRQQARSFNLFNVLHLEAREDLVHTPLLADLLSPQGAHGQGYLFLHAFIDALTASHAGFPAPVEAIADHPWFVEAHKYIGDGAPDIVLACPGLSYLLVLENKVYADEQPDQLARYARWMEGQQETYSSQALLYLTPTGEASETAGSAAYYRISYRREIAGLLKASLTDISAPHLRETIHQYLEVIQNF
ncbi:MAG: PD-(D/E)XK nuclease family protein [Candidatus Marinimicrobia bacterium]|nr:PD-(D/E)XK nuclease family protein [Candidatus Neomarinimicrobiota bacterium]